MNTPTEMMAERVRLGLSRKELADLTGDNESFIRQIEHVKAINVPLHVKDQLNMLLTIRHDMIDRWKKRDNEFPCVLLTYHSDDDLMASGGSWDRKAPTASFHRAVMAELRCRLHEAPEPTLMLCFHLPLFERSDHAKRGDTFDNRRAWAIDWAKQYREIEA